MCQEKQQHDLHICEGAVILLFKKLDKTSLKVGWSYLIQRLYKQNSYITDHIHSSKLSFLRVLVSVNIAIVK